MNLSASSAKPADPTYFLEGIIHDKSEMADFEGPLSLILLLLSKNKIEIRDIKISEILDQYLEYLNAMEKLDLEIASEFVQMASYLLYIKTRMLLTEEKEVTELEQLIASLEQLKCKDTYAAVKSVTPMLDAAAQTGLHGCRRAQLVRVGDGRGQDLLAGHIQHGERLDVDLLDVGLQQDLIPGMDLHRREDAVL